MGDRKEGGSWDEDGGEKNGDSNNIHSLCTRSHVDTKGITALIQTNSMCIKPLSLSLTLPSLS